MKLNNKNIFYLLCSAFFSTFLSGCTSHSLKAAANLDSNRPEYLSVKCEEAKNSALIQDELKWGRSIASPALILLSGGTLFLPVLASNMGLDTADNIQASNISVACGGKSKSNEEIATNILSGAAVGLVSQGIIPNVGLPLTNK